MTPKSINALMKIMGGTARVFKSAEKLKRKNQGIWDIIMVTRDTAIAAPLLRWF